MYISQMQVFFLAAAFCVFFFPPSLSSYLCFSSASLPGPTLHSSSPLRIPLIALLLFPVFTSLSPLHHSYLCLGDTIVARGQMLSDRLTGWYGHRYTGSEVCSKPWRLAGRHTRSHKTFEKGESEGEAVRRRGSWQADGGGGRLSSRREADTTAVAIKKGDIWDM